MTRPFNVDEAVVALMREVLTPPVNVVVAAVAKVLTSESNVVEETTIEPPKDTAEPFTVIWELTKFPLVMIPVPVSNAKEAAPVRESDVP